MAFLAIIPSSYLVVVFIQECLLNGMGEQGFL